MKTDLSPETKDTKRKNSWLSTRLPHVYLAFVIFCFAQFSVPRVPTCQPFSVFFQVFFFSL